MTDAPPTIAPVRHIVLCKLHPSQGPAFAQVAADLQGLAKRLSIGALVHGTNISPEGFDRGYTHGFTIDFPNFDALQTYLRDPGHQAIGARLVDLCQGGLDGILVMDL